jgi:Rod binding domain-containing protein
MSVFISLFRMSFIQSCVCYKDTLTQIYDSLLCSFVPANSAEIGLTDMIVTRMKTQETVSKVKYNATKSFYTAIQSKIRVP